MGSIEHALVATRPTRIRNSRHRKPFNGSLVCAPFLEFKDTDEEGQTRTALVPIAEDGFVFFYNEDKERLLSRFVPWRENVIKVALKELTQNL